MELNELFLQYAPKMPRVEKWRFDNKKGSKQTNLND